MPAHWTAQGLHQCLWKLQHHEFINPNILKQKACLQVTTETEENAIWILFLLACDVALNYGNNSLFQRFPTHKKAFFLSSVSCFIFLPQLAISRSHFSRVAQADEGFVLLRLWDQLIPCPPRLNLLTHVSVMSLLCWFSQLSWAQQCRLGYGTPPSGGVRGDSADSRGGTGSF